MKRNGSKDKEPLAKKSRWDSAKNEGLVQIVNQTFGNLKIEGKSTKYNMKRKGNNNEEPRSKRIKRDLKFPLEDLAINKGLVHIVNQIFSNLNARDLSNLRLVSSTFSKIIDNNKYWWTLQLKYMRKKPTYFNFFKTMDSKKLVKFKYPFENRFPEWKIVNEHFLKKETLHRLQNHVFWLWDYFNDSEKFNWECPMIYAIRNSSLNFVQMFLDTPFNFNKKMEGKPILHYACETKRGSVLSLLIKNAEKLKIDFNAVDNNGKTALHHACKYGTVHVVKMLTDYLQTLDIFQRTQNGSNIFHLAAINPDNRVMEYLLRKFKHDFIDKEDFDGYRLLHCALENGTNETVKFLLDSRSEFGIDISANTFNDKNVLHLAVKYERFDMIAYLYEALDEDSFNLDIEVDNHGRTPFHLACKNAKLKIIKDLVYMRPKLIKNFYSGVDDFALTGKRKEVWDFIQKYRLRNMAKSFQ